MTLGSMFGLAVIAMIIIGVTAGRIEDLHNQGRTRLATILTGILIPSTMIGAILFMVFFVVPKIHS